MDRDLTTRRLSLFPITARVEGDGLTIGGCDLRDLADRFGTPLYLYDRATLDDAVDAYRQALARFYPGPAGLTYAGKAFLSLALVRWLTRQDLWLDCTGRGELAVAAAGGMEPARVLVHGVNKSAADLEAARRQAGTIVVDNLTELAALIALARQDGPPLPNLWLRIRPGQAVKTHRHIQTGQADSKFGLSTAEATEAARLCRRHGLPLTGLHFHLGSHFHDAAPVCAALETLLDLAAAWRAEWGWHLEAISPGGGWGVAYHEDDLPHPSISDFVAATAQCLAKGCRARDLPLPRLQLEPGRSIVARAGVALYRVGAVKRTPHRRWLLLDGGLADNPRPALYGARYSALPVERPQREAVGPAWLAGPYCESGDVLIENLPLPDVRPGELIAVPVGGAYHLSMSSNYNGALRPAVLWLEGGRAYLIRERERVEDLLRRERPLPETA